MQNAENNIYSPPDFNFFWKSMPSDNPSNIETTTTTTTTTTCTRGQC